MSTLIEITRRKLKEDSRSLASISVGSGLSYHWLNSFKSARAASPGAAEVQALYEFLTGKPLTLE